MKIYPYVSLQVAQHLRTLHAHQRGPVQGYLTQDREGKMVQIEIDLDKFSVTEKYNLLDAFLEIKYRKEGECL